MKPAALVLAVALCASISASTTHAREIAQSPLMYRGRLTDAGSPANGLYDMTFKLFDAAAGGAQVGPTITSDNARIQDGRVTIDLDFGPQTFAGTSQWLEIGVRSGTSTESYTALVPRHQVTGASSSTFASTLAVKAEPGGGVAPPPSAVMFFNLTTCPQGWTEVAAGRGRYVVGYQPGATLASTVGTALGVDENRPVGQHTHSINDPGHAHPYSAAVPTSTGSGNSKAGYESQMTGTAVTGITINNAGSAPGTNAPYIVLLMCQKD